MPSRAAAEQLRQTATQFLFAELGLTVNPKIDMIVPAWQGISYLGVELWPTGRRLQPDVRVRVQRRLHVSNAASYQALIMAHENHKQIRLINWQLLDNDAYAWGEVQ